jgi:hypothetical protein
MSSESRLRGAVQFRQLVPDFPFALTQLFRNLDLRLNE